MIKLSTLDVRKNLGDILNRVALRHDEYIIERKGKPLAAMVPLSKLEAMRRAARVQLLDVLNQEGGLTEGDAMALANEAKHASREN